MENYKLYEKFFDYKFCSEVIENYTKNFKYEPRGTWNSWTIKNDEYKKYLIDKVKNIIPYGIKNSWINITVYRDGYGLRLHNDESSEHTIVVNLNEGYNGGNFILETESKSLKLGDVLVFNGNKIKHGVEPVLNGVRYSLNYWFTFDDDKVNKPKKRII